ncbi:hypothetical protein R5R73_04745 [Salinicola sp. LHM]|uniref:hypothetical protein n=1 Tax=Salinicola sp. LHM TaxID=3065298 RepID=UPI002ACE86FA|nr:hypothetical protein [Salinicola sp. LHM]WQH33997.1 hypothetical protein R5R73_04745 [Salinicola sp. LHM]
MTQRTAREIHLRCMVQTEQGLFVAHCIDLNLAAQARSSEEAKAKLDEMIRSHFMAVSEIAREGDMDSAMALLKRRSPLSIRAKWHVAHALGQIRASFRAVGKAWEENRPSPLNAPA